MSYPNYFRYEQTFLSSFVSNFDASVTFYLNIRTKYKNGGLWFYEPNSYNDSVLNPLFFTNWDRLQPKTKGFALTDGKLQETQNTKWFEFIQNCC